MGYQLAPEFDDSLGNTVALTDDVGVVVEEYLYDIYGTPSITDGAGTPLSPTYASDYGNRFMFTGREYLAELDLYDYRNRVYSPVIGRFLQTDPIGFDSDINLYRYVGNEPVNWIDPLGLDGKKGDRGARNAGRDGHRGGNKPEKHEDAQGHGGKKGKPNFKRVNRRGVRVSIWDWLPILDLPKPDDLPTETDADPDGKCPPGYVPFDVPFEEFDPNGCPTDDKPAPKPTKCIRSDRYA